MIRFILLLVLWGFSLFAWGDEIHVLTVSHHWNKFDDRTYNEFNPGVFYANDIIGGLKGIGGVYKNTFSKMSWTLGAEYESKGQGGFSVGGQIGLANGYEEMTGMKISVTGTLFLQKMIVDGFGIRVAFIPHDEGAVGLLLVKDI